MNTNETRTSTHPATRAWLVVLTILGMWFVLGALLFVLAHQLSFPLGWFYFGLFATGSGIGKACLLIFNPGLFWRRQRIGSGTKTWARRR